MKNMRIRLEQSKLLIFKAKKFNKLSDKEYKTRK